MTLETIDPDILSGDDFNAQRIQQDALAYQDRVIRDAEGEAARFEALLAEYQKAPRVTRDRLYIDAIEQVYGSTNKVLLDSRGSGNLLYLPIDKLIQGSSGGAPRENMRPNDQSRDAYQQNETSGERERRTRQ